MLHWVSAERTSQRAHSLFPMQRCKLTGMNVNFLVRDGPKRRRYMCRAPNAISPRGARSSIVVGRGTPLRPSAASSSFRPCSSRHLSASRRALRGRTSVAPTTFKWATMAPLVVVALTDAPCSRFRPPEEGSRELPYLAKRKNALVFGPFEFCARE